MRLAFSQMRLAKIKTEAAFQPCASRILFFASRKILLLFFCVSFVNTLYRPTLLLTAYLGNLSFTLQLEMCPVCRFETLKKYKTDGRGGKTEREESGIKCVLYNKAQVAPTEIGESAFAGATAIVLMDLSKATLIGKNAFNGATAFTGTDEKVRNVVDITADVTTLNNYGTIDFIYLKNAALKVTTLNNHNKLTVKQSTENKTETVLTVGTLNNKVNFAAHPTVIVDLCTDGDNYRNAKLDATTINNEAYKKYPDNNSTQYKPAITINGLTSAATVTNKGYLTWSSVKEMNFTLTNQKIFTISKGKVTGSITNSGTFNVNSTVQLDGAVTTTGITNVNDGGNLIAANAKFTVNGGTVNCYGTINGSSNIAVQKGDFIKYVSDKNNLEAALLTTGVAAKYNAIAINGDISDATVKTDKTVYLDANLTTSGASEFKKLVSRGDDVTYNAKKGATVESLEIKSGTLTLNGTVININGTFTNNRGCTYSSKSTAVVNCAGISGTGTWGKYPNF